MKVKRIIPIIVAAVVIVGGITVYYTIASATDNSISSLTVNNPLFSTNQSSLYYKLEQAIGDEGMPSDSITVNLNNTVNINMYLTFFLCSTWNIKKDTHIKLMLKLLTSVPDLVPLFNVVSTGII